MMRSAKIMLIVLAAILTLPPGPAIPAEPGPAEFTVIYSTDVNGETEPCG